MGGGYISKSGIVRKRWVEVIFFHLKAKYLVFHFIDLNGTILNLI